ncbi:VWA domain-containing protein [Methylobacterium mesophilicum SR1.6/6]|uniref:VWA domain-containing protein n=1 Tax=Methylobacterium mesophilicum SR1.6/6 TaxID=908290 RepID=A0A6B9FKF8_9HYPH|nr:VWA domain-containing protein [Methylobacterium mesophilicum]QGY02439.1 VWA domain-containing protein [Methylobacterium mesophilicum SR1.6/6]
MSETERLRRWRLVLGGGLAEGTGHALAERDLRLDRALGALYDSDRQGGLGSSAPSVPRWLGDIRDYFPAAVVQVMQRDALDRLDLKRMLTEPEMLEAVVPDVALVSTLISMRGVLSGRTKETARLVVRKVVDALLAKLEEPLRQAVNGAIDRASVNRPRHAEIDWNRTIRANLRHYQAEYRTIIPETRLGHGRKSRGSLKDVILCIDQSGSMANSVVYSSIFGAVMASLPAVSTRLVVFDTEVVDLTDDLDDPVEVLFSVQLGGGTDINRAVGYCASRITRPEDTVLVLISDLYEGGVEAGLLAQAQRLVASGVQVVALLALSDEGAPAYDRSLAARLAALGVPAFACTPDLFPDLMAAAIRKADLEAWAASAGIAAVAADAGPRTE